MGLEWEEQQKSDHMDQPQEPLLRSLIPKPETLAY
jgi:hypothetical protein